MRRREFSQLTTAIGAGVALDRITRAADSSASDRRLNILLIMTDQQHAGMMSCTGNTWLKTPAMDRLAKEGVRFSRAYAANPVCVPSRTSMATGVMPGRFGVFSNGKTAHIPAEVDRNSLGKLMKRAGYDTFYGGKVHMCKELTPTNAGYDAFERNSRSELPGACIELIRRKRSKPFFAVASFINPHDICFAYRARHGKNARVMAHVDKMYRTASAMPLEQLPPLPKNHGLCEGEPPAVEAHMSPRAVTPAITMRTEYNDKQWRIYRYIYCRLTEMVDRRVGQILDAIDKADLARRTLVIFTSDHGNMDASHHLASKGVFYEESVGVPMLMWLPGAIQKGTVDQHLVCNGLDILPTLCDYAGIEMPKGLLGRSLRPIAEGKPPTAWRPYVVAENKSGRMIRSDRYKYCVYDEGEPRESLVDLEADPGEMKSVAADPQYKDALAQHRQYLKDWVQQSGDKEGRAFVIQG